MARVTVEDCLENVNNRFELVMIASKRARQLATGGKEALVKEDGDKPTVIALREIEEGLVDDSILLETEQAEEAFQEEPEMPEPEASEFGVSPTPPPTSSTISHGLGDFRRSEASMAEQAASAAPEADTSTDDALAAALAAQLGGSSEPQVEAAADAEPTEQEAAPAAPLDDDSISTDALIRALQQSAEGEEPGSDAEE